LTLELFWFCLIAVLWGGYFVLEGFDFGVGMLVPFIASRRRDRDTVLESIAPVWDGNEVWLVVAAAATFAAFPTWYATMFSGFYLALLLILVFLILRAVSFEWRGKGDGARWERFWLTATVVSSFAVPFLWGVALANLLDGVPLNSSGDYSGNLVDLFSAYTVFTGLAVVALFAFHGATFLTERLSGTLCERAASIASGLAVPVALVIAGFAAWTVSLAVDRNDKSAFPPVLPAVLTALALGAAVVFVRRGQSTRSFVATALGAVLMVATLFTSLYPRVIVSHPDFANSLTTSATASSHYALVVITIVAAVLTPVVLVYQGWTYYVFRARLSGDDVEPPLKVVAQRTGGTPAG
jgi:cytochrome bd ubiquinol oxidase subunit II